MIRSILSIAIAILLCSKPASALTQAQLTAKATQIPIGGVVEVKTKSGKLKGQLLAMDASGVTVRTTTRNAGIAEQEVAFADMKDIKPIDTTDHATRGLAVFGGIMLVWIIIGTIIMAVGGGA